MKSTKSFLKKIPRIPKRIVLIFFGVIILVMLIAASVFWLIDSRLFNNKYAPKYSEEAPRNLEAEILFNNKVGESEFSAAFVGLIRSASSSIDLAMYSLDSTEIRDELYKAANRGVIVRAVVSSNKRTQYNNLFKDKPANVFLSEENLGPKQNGFMHNKYIISDANSSKKTMITGSFNSTRLQELYDPSFIFKTYDETMIKYYGQEFERLFSGKSGLAKFNDKTYSAWQADLNYKNGKMEIWWSPGSGEVTIKKRMLELIYQAEESIDIMIWQTTDKEISQALIDKAASGVKVRIIADDSNAWLDVSALPQIVAASLNSNNLIIVDDAARTVDFLNEIFKDSLVDKNNFNSFLHHHALIIDKKILISGSGNWSYSANFSNDENTLITTVPDLIKLYQDSFDFNFNKLHKQSLEFKLSQEEIILPNLNSYLGYNLVLLGEDSKSAPMTQICSSEIIRLNEFKIKIPENCKNKALNIFIINSTGEVEANRLIGKINI
ncbi:MAG: phospholipase D-like domain-containing protein [Patescibacteria group bacterium]